MCWGEHLPHCTGESYCSSRGQSSALRMCMRMLPVPAHLSSPACFSESFPPVPCCSPSCQGSAILTHQSFVCHSPVPSAPAALTSSIPHLFITQHHRCRFLPAPPSKAPRLASPSQTLPWGQLTEPSAPGPISPLNSFSLPCWPGDPGPQFQPLCPFLGDIHQVCETLPLG